MSKLKPKRFGRLTVLNDGYIWHWDKRDVNLTENQTITLDTIILCGCDTWWAGDIAVDILAEWGMYHSDNMCGREHLYKVARYVRKHWEWVR